MVNGPNEFPFSFADRFFLFQLGEQKGKRAGIRAKKLEAWTGDVLNLPNFFLVNSCKSTVCKVNSIQNKHFGNKSCVTVVSHFVPQRNASINL